MRVRSIKSDHQFIDELGLLGNSQAGALDTDQADVQKSYPAGPARMAHARDYLKKTHGLPDHAAAAIAGQGFAESGLDTSAVGDNGTAIGAFQHRLDRAENLKKFATENGSTYADLEKNLDFVVHELKTSEKFAGEALLIGGNAIFRYELIESITASCRVVRPETIGWSAGDSVWFKGMEERIGSIRMSCQRGRKAN